MADRNDNLIDSGIGQPSVSRVVIDADAASVFDSGVIVDILAPGEQVTPPTKESAEHVQNAEAEADTDYGFGILGATGREQTRSERIRQTRREAGIARDNEQIERLRRENEAAVQRQAEEADEIRRGLGELFSSIQSTATEGEGSAEEGGAVSATDMSENSERQEESAPAVTQAPENEGDQNGNKQQKAPNLGQKPAADEEIDYTITVGESLGADLLHIGGVTVAEIGVLADGTLTVSPPDSGHPVSENPMQAGVDLTQVRTENLTRVEPTSQNPQAASAPDKEQTADYDISSPYPDPTPVSVPEQSSVDIRQEEPEGLARDDTPRSMDVEHFEREHELTHQGIDTQRGQNSDPEGRTNDHPIDTSSSYPEAPLEPKKNPGQERQRRDNESAQRQEEMTRVLREAQEDERRRRSQTSSVDPVVDMERAAEVDASGRSESVKSEPPKEEYSFNKRERAAKKARQTKLDLEAVEARLLADVFELRSQNALYEYSYMRQLEDGSAKKARIKVSTALKKAERKMSPARTYEIKDNERFYRLTLINLSNAKLPSRADRATLMALQTELGELLERRDELNRRLLELYRGSDGGKKEFAKGRLDADIAGRRAEYRRLDKLNREVCSYRISLENKKHIFTLMDRRILLVGEFERVRYILNRERPKGDYHKALVKEKKRIEQELKENRKELDALVKKVLTKAEKSRKSMVAMAFGWGIFLILVIGGIAAYIFRDSLLAWLTGFFPGA